MLRVDIIIPTFNRSEFLRSAIQSILDQTFQDFRIIIVDDASNSDVYDLVRRFPQERIVYIRHDTNTGEAGARNTGVRNSQAEYIAFLDDDDEWLPDKLRLEVALLDKSTSKVGVIYTGYYLVDKLTGKMLAQRVPTSRGNIHDQLMFENIVGGPSTVLMRRECFERYGLFDEQIAYGLDHDMWIRISEGFEYEFIKDPLVKRHVHLDQLSSNFEKRILGIEALLNKHRGFYASNRMALSAQYISLGYAYQQNNNFAQASRSFFKAILLYPFDISYYANLCKLVPLFVLGRRYCHRLRDLKVRMVGHRKHKKSEGYWNLPN